MLSIKKSNIMQSFILVCDKNRQLYIFKKIGQKTYYLVGRNFYEVQEFIEPKPGQKFVFSYMLKNMPIFVKTRRVVQVSHP